MSRGIAFLTDDSRWKKPGLEAFLKRAAARALAACPFEGKSALTILLTSDARLKELNRDFRGKNKPTNVLSFPAPLNEEGYRGDIALAYGVTAAEAKDAGKRLRDHAAHLVVHGVLHLAGHDHIKERDAKKMESLEVQILAKLKIANPYGSIGQEKCLPQRSHAGRAVFRPAVRPKKEVMA